MLLAEVSQKLDSVTAWSNMGWVDVLVFIVFILGVFFGLKKGFAAMLAGLAEVVIADVVVVEYTAQVASSLSTRFQIPQDTISFLIFAALAICTIVLLKFTFKVLSLIASVQFKSPLNHIGGALTGALQFLLLFGLVAEFLMMFKISFIQESFQQKSISGPYLIQVSEQVHYIFERWIPASFRVS